jgi:hypothetical protein
MKKENNTKGQKIREVLSLSFAIGNIKQSQMSRAHECVLSKLFLSSFPTESSQEDIVNDEKIQVMKLPL